MPTYEYECKDCGLRFERRQAITENPVNECPECHGRVERLISGGIGFISEGSNSQKYRQQENNCPMERTGKTCCGRDERCHTPQCEDNK